MKIIIVGGVAGGATAAARIRRLMEEATVVLYEKGPYISYANCGLPYYIGGVIKDRASLLLQTPEKFDSHYHVEVKVLHEVLKVLPEEQKVIVKDLQTGETFEDSYDQLVLSPGSQPLRPPIPGIDLPGIFTLWNVPDTDRIKRFLEEKKPKNAVVVGGGFIGIEMAENLRHAGLEVTLVEMMNQVMAPFDYDMALMLHRHLRECGVQLMLETRVERFEAAKDQLSVKLSGGESLETQLVILCLGVRPQTAFLKDSGLAMNARGALVVDEHMLTNDPRIYALGDAVEVADFVSQTPTMIPLAGPANKQARIVADNLWKPGSSVYRGSQGTCIVQVFDLTAATTGHNERQLQARGLRKGPDYDVVLIQSKSHAGYYPGSCGMTLKALCETESRKILGAQIIGYDGVDKRIDVLAAVQRLGGTLDDLQELELAYAPPYSSAKDPINMVGFVGNNQKKGLVRHVQIPEMKEGDYTLLDIRVPEEWNLGEIEGAVQIPLEQLRHRLDELDRDRHYLVFCAIGVRGYIATRILMQHGFMASNLAGGYAAYNNYSCGEEELVCRNIPVATMMDFSEGGAALGKAPLDGKTVTLDACGLQCPGPIMQVAEAMKALEEGDYLQVSATDPGFLRDIGAWSERTGNRLIESGKVDKTIQALIQKGQPRAMVRPAEIPHNKTIVVFSGDLDKAIASLIIANGAASMGRKVTLFFTFWGLNVLRRSERVPVKKNLLERMFSAMMPRGTGKMGLSRMNFMGMGPRLIRKIMRDKNVDQVEALLEQALKQGVHLIACNMSMDLMGIREEELIDGVEMGGVASYLAEAENADTNLFI